MYNIVRIKINTGQVNFLIIDTYFIFGGTEVIHWIIFGRDPFGLLHKKSCTMSYELTAPLIPNIDFKTEDTGYNGCYSETVSSSQNYYQNAYVPPSQSNYDQGMIYKFHLII